MDFKDSVFCQQTNQTCSQEISSGLLVLTNLLSCSQCLSRRYLCECERALCVVGNELVQVSMQQGVYLQAI